MIPDLLFMPNCDLTRIGEQLMKHVGKRFLVLGYSWEVGENIVVRSPKFIFKLPMTEASENNTDQHCSSMFSENPSDPISCKSFH